MPKVLLLDVEHNLREDLLMSQEFGAWKFLQEYTVQLHEP